MKDKKVKGYVSVTEEMKSQYFKEEYKGEVIDVPVRFPKELGAEHPFNFEDAEKVFKKVGLINGGINKIADNIIGEFSVTVDNPNSQKILDGLVHDPSFKPSIREWIIEGLAKGNGFLDLTDIKNYKVQVLNANDMFVKRSNKGVVKEYNQFLGRIATFSPSSRKLIPFTPQEIAHWKCNKISGEAYGYGIIMPNERVIENLVKMEQDHVKLIGRKAGAPIHAKLGQPGEAVASEDVDAMADKLKFMNNRTEWVTDGNVEYKVIDFGPLGDSLENAMTYTFHQLIAGMQLPEVLLGSGQLNEGIARVQLEGLQRTIAAYQDEIEGIIEEQIFRPLLNANKLDEKIEFKWNLPSETEINARLEKLTALLGNFNITENMKRMIQIEIAHLLNIENADDYLIEPEVGADEEMVDMEKQVKQAAIDGTMAKTQLTKTSNEAKKEANIKQPESPGAKPNAKEKLELISLNQLLNDSVMADSGDITLREWVNFNEIKGFNYSDYIIAILKRLRIDKFEDLAALNESDLQMGLLSENDIKKLRIILKDGFRKNKTIRQIEKEVKDNIDLKDRFDEEGKLQLTAEKRPSIITRTETIRIANAGLLDNYKENDVKNVRWLAALSDRTCPECEAKNGEVHQLNESYGLIPLHPNCRCSWLSI
jgi:SPP1 gp7 family putative phage head morphogenesis protein